MTSYKLGTWYKRRISKYIHSRCFTPRDFFFFLTQVKFEPTRSAKLIPSRTWVGYGWVATSFRFHDPILYQNSSTIGQTIDRAWWMWDRKWEHCIKVFFRRGWRWFLLWLMKNKCKLCCDQIIFPIITMHYWSSIFKGFSKLFEALARIQII